MFRPTPSGEFRHRMTLEKPTVNQNAFGENLVTWVSIATVWVAKRTLSGRQLALATADTRTATSTHQLRIRYREDLLPTYRLREMGTSTMGYETLDLPTYEALDLPTFEALTTSGTIGGKRSVYQFDAIDNVEGRNREYCLTCTRVDA